MLSSVVAPELIREAPGIIVGAVAQAEGGLAVKLVLEVGISLS